MKRVILLAILVTAFFGCSKTAKNSNPSEDEILDLAMSKGEQIAGTAQKALGGQLKKVILQSGPVAAVKFCNLAAYPILDTLQLEVPARIARVSSRTRNPRNKPNQIASEILNSFESSIEKREKPNAIVQVLSDDQVLFAKPILLNNPMCLNCHGEIGAQVAEQTLTTLQELYPDDKATGHKMGDLRGMWTIGFQKEDLIKYLKK